MNLMHFPPLIRLSTVGLFFLALGMLACEGNSPEPATKGPQATPKARKAAEYPKLDSKVSAPEAIKSHNVPRFDREPRIPGDFKGNYIWAAPMNLAWEELRDKILKAQFSTSDTTQGDLETISNLNAAKFSKKDLDAASYYVRSGFGKPIVDTIKVELKKKFPSNRVVLSGDNLDPWDLFIFAFLQKKLQYLHPFSPRDVGFKDKSVKGFIDLQHEQKKNVRILHYTSDAQFLIRLVLQQDGDELFLAKGFNMITPTQVLDEIHFHAGKQERAMEYIDRFSAPNLDLKFARTIHFEQTQLTNPGFEAYSLSSI